MEVVLNGEKERTKNIEGLGKKGIDRRWKEKRGDTFLWTYREKEKETLGQHVQPGPIVYNYRKSARLSCRCASLSKTE
jgi:hypothetical protein